MSTPTESGTLPASVTSADGDGLLITSVPEDLQIVRQSFRVPVPHGVITLSFDGRSYIVKDLSMYGVGVAVDSPDIFSAGDVLHGAQIVFPEKIFTVDIKVIHISPHDAGGLVCGMHISEPLNAGYIDWMTRVVQEIKASVLNSVRANL